MAGLQLSGLVSGIDTGSIIDAADGDREGAADQDHARPGRDDQAPEPPAGRCRRKLTALKSANDDLKSVAQLARHPDRRDRRRDEGHGVAHRRRAARRLRRRDHPAGLAPSARPTRFVAPAADGTLDIANADGSARDLDRAEGRRDARRRGRRRSTAPSTSKLYAVNVNGSLVLSAKTTGDSSGFGDHRRRRRRPDRARRGQERARSRSTARAYERQTQHHHRRASPACSSR